MENQINAFEIHTAIIAIVNENQGSLFFNDDAKKMSYLVDNIENMTLNAVKHYVQKDESILFNDELIQEMDNLRDAVKALQSNKVFKNPAMSGILKKQIDSLTKEYNKNLLKLVAPIYQKTGMFDDLEDIQESSPENESGQDTENEIQE